MFILALVAALLLIPAVALAAPSVTYGSSLEEIARVVYYSIVKGDWRIAAVIGVILVTQLAKRVWPKLAEGKAAWVAAIVIGVAGAVGNAWLANVAVAGVFGYAMLAVNGAITGLAAAGLYRGAQKLSEQKDPPL